MNLGDFTRVSPCYDLQPSTVVKHHTHHEANESLDACRATVTYTCTHLRTNENIITHKLRFLETPGVSLTA